MNKERFFEIYEEYGLEGEPEGAQPVIEKLFDECVPSVGKADTVFGEIVRAINQIGYRYYNDGDTIGFNYGVETVSPSARYLQYHTNETIACFIKGMANYDFEVDYEAKEYERLLDTLVCYISDFLFENTQLLEVENTENCRNFKAQGKPFDFEDIDEEAEEYEEEYW